MQYLALRKKALNTRGDPLTLLPLHNLATGEHIYLGHFRAFQDAPIGLPALQTYLKRIREYLDGIYRRTHHRKVMPHKAYRSDKLMSARGNREDSGNIAWIKLKKGIFMEPSTRRSMANSPSRPFFS
jgi:hypothetical protein